MASTSEHIASFWKWFSDHSSELSAPSIPDLLITELEQRLFLIHRLDWEIGPGLKEANLFALSPRGDRETLCLTRYIIADAPKIKGWEFHPAKPRRTWNLIFNLMVDREPVEVDAKLWEFVAYKFNDGTYDLIFKPHLGKTLTEDYLHWAATIIVDGELGEEKRMERIGKIEIVTSWDEKAAPSARKLEIGLLEKVL